MTQRIVDEELLHSISDALKALMPDEKDNNHDGHDARDVRQWLRVQAALSTTLEQPAVEPVAWRVHPATYGVGHDGVYALTTRTEQIDAWRRKGWDVEPLFTAPQAQPAVNKDWDAVTVANQKYAPLVKAAINLICAVHENPKNTQPPQCFGVPFAELNALHEALGAQPLAAPQPQQLASGPVGYVRMVNGEPTPDDNGCVFSYGKNPYRDTYGDEEWLPVSIAAPQAQEKS